MLRKEASIAKSQVFYKSNKVVEEEQERKEQLRKAIVKERLLANFRSN